MTIDFDNETYEVDLADGDFKELLARLNDDAEVLKRLRNAIRNKAKKAEDKDADRAIESMNKRLLELGSGGTPPAVTQAQPQPSGLMLGDLTLEDGLAQLKVKQQAVGGQLRSRVDKVIGEIEPVLARQKTYRGKEDYDHWFGVAKDALGTRWSGRARSRRRRPRRPPRHPHRRRRCASSSRT